MSIDFGSLIIDLEILANSSNEDFYKEFWSEYENYLEKYNSLLRNLQSLGFFKELKFVDSVPLSDQSFDSGFSKYEKAKLREISNAATALLRKVKLLLSPPVSEIKLNNKVRSNKIFVVSGNDRELKSNVIQNLEKLDLDPIILDGETGAAKKIIEEINKYCNVSFAVVLLSPDEIDHSIKKTTDAAKLSSNQRVFFELGYFIGKLGKQNVVSIYKNKKFFQFLNDFNGLQWIEYKMGWYYDLIKILKNCNFNVNANKISWI